MPPDPVHHAVAEAQRRQNISDRDLSASVEYFTATVRLVCHDWGLTVHDWLSGGAGTPPLSVSSADGTSAVLKIADDVKVEFSKSAIVQVLATEAK